ncbi:MAG: nucleotidyl transferase AbiEii/AbiGii toxin family protein [Nitrosomonadales bacterium]
MLHSQTLAPQTLGLIQSLQEEPLLRGFHLVGGTALALQIGHRMSIDIDLFTRDDYEVDEALALFINKYNFQRSYQRGKTVKGFIDGVMIDLNRHDYEELQVIEEDRVRMLSAGDIAAMKLNAITGNGTRVKDYVDVFFLLELFRLEEMLDFYKTKYRQDDALMILRSLVFFDDVDLAEWPRLIREPLLTFDRVKERIGDAVKPLL